MSTTRLARPFLGDACTCGTCLTVPLDRSFFWTEPFGQIVDVSKSSCQSPRAVLSVSILCVQYYGVKLWSNSGDPIGWVVLTGGLKTAPGKLE